MDREDSEPLHQPADTDVREPLEGRIHSCEGPLARKTTKVKKWKKRWFRIAPGKLYIV